MVRSSIQPLASSDGGLPLSTMTAAESCTLEMRTESGLVMPCRGSDPVHSRSLGSEEPLQLSVPFDRVISSVASRIGIPGRKPEKLSGGRA